MKETPLIQAEQLTIGYSDKVVLQDLNFSVCPGDALYVLGENGSGKSTLIKTILRLQKPLSGSIRYREDLKPNEIGYLPQQSGIQRNFPASVWEIVLSGCINRLGRHPFFTSKEKNIARENLALMGISDLASHSYQHLSGGQQQRVLLARALCASGKILLLDEPVTGLDPLATTDLYHLIEKVNRELGVTVITVSHDLTAADRYGDHILHLSHDGYFYGTKEEYRNSPFYQHFYRGNPS